MRWRNIWLLTALAVACSCGWPVWQGYDLIRYALADAKPEAVRPWVTVPGLAFAAREYALTPINDSSDDKTIRKRRDELVEMLAIRPLASYYWLQLAESRIDAQEAPTKAVEALELSGVTGSNEGYLITQRGLFGIWQWEVLSPETQQRAVKDLMATRIPDGKFAWLRMTLSDKTDQVRQEIRLALQAQGFSKSDFARIGF
jgi:hypothetical protein